MSWKRELASQVNTYWHILLAQKAAPNSLAEKANDGQEANITDNVTSQEEASVSEAATDKEVDLATIAKTFVNQSVNHSGLFV